MLFRSFWHQRHAQPPRNWRCDWTAYCRYVESESPDLFGDWVTAEKWVLEAMQRFTIHKTRRQRRAEWEPFSVKILRAQTRSCEVEHERIELSRQLFALRKHVAGERDKQLLRSHLRRGQTFTLKKVALFQ